MSSQLLTERYNKLRAAGSGCWLTSNGRLREKF
jgi:hypothetical protein